MPVSPKLAMRLALELRGLYEAATNELIRAIAVQVGRGAQDATWQDRKLEALTLLMHDVDRTIDDLRREVPGAVERALGYAYRRGSPLHPSRRKRQASPAHSGSCPTRKPSHGYCRKRCDRMSR